MKKASGILLWSALIVEIIFIVTVIPAMILMLANLGFTPDLSDIGMSALIRLPKVLLPLIVKVIMVIILLSGLANREKVIFPEILTIILFCGIGSVGNPLIENMISQFMALRGEKMFVVFMMMGNAYGYVGVLHTISNSLLLVGAALGIAHKKLILPIVEE